MKIMIRLAVLFYMTLILILGCFLILFSLNVLPYHQVVDAILFAYTDVQLRMIIGVVAVALLVKNHFFAKALLGDQQRGKTIAFDNPSGRVSVSLAALEDLVRREVARVPEVKEVRATILAGRKGLEVSARLVLNADVNIPEMTSGLQEQVKRKIQDTIGIEEAVLVKVHVNKIVPEIGKHKRPKVNKQDDQPAQPAVPFEGYRA